MVEIVGDLIALRLRHIAHADALGKVLSQQAVEVFVAATLPRVVRRGEIDLHRELPFECDVVVKLGAVIERERLEVAAVPTDGAGSRSRDLIGVAGGQLFDDRETGFAFDQREHAMPQVTADHRVTFPMPDALSVLDFQRSLGNGALTRQHAP